ncbi:XdhC family protein [Lysobacter sp. S4-A87]|uniref:XdhC family protein n=1 Tax=Lysobacter sp. S4-A87 TaxID=2925843 RepID=UPI001F53566D|nr:XdhC/CoxI family protein [Lysobacter sp. S4-A87]UNK48616.1 XdhC family protein [Lysobacter sp. S4-A87]
MDTFLPGATRGVLEAAANAIAHGEPAALAVVLETSGSTYVHAGALALFGSEGRQVGWLSGGCLEPEIALRADEAVRTQMIQWLEIDTRNDEDLLSGSAVGCRGRLRIALLPLATLAPWPALITAWRSRQGAFEVTLDPSGALAASVGTQQGRHRFKAAGVPWPDVPPAWTLSIARPPSVLLLGAGPETALLLPMLRLIGATTTVVERRPRWQSAAASADVTVAQSPAQVLPAADGQFDAALVMHHHFELDREALAALADSAIGFVGLLGPVRRREDLFRVLPSSVRDALMPRLHSPVGLALGGSGPEAIALSIAAQLHNHLHGGRA